MRKIFCQYREIFGEAGKGVHAWRVGDVAVVDAGLTVAATWVLARWWNLPFWMTLLGLFIVGIFLHWLFCVPTRVARWLGISPAGN